MKRNADPYDGISYAKALRSTADLVIESLYPRMSSCGFCGRYWSGSKLSAGLCPQCLLEWQRFRQRACICPRCGSFDSGNPCQGPCADATDGTADSCGSLKAIFAAAPYTGVYRQRIMSFKYNGAVHQAQPMAYLMAEALRDGMRLHRAVFGGSASGQGEAKPCLVPVPMHIQKETQRGYNQSRLLAEAIRKETGFPILELLSRPSPGQMQAGLDKAHRKTALDQVFQWCGAADGARGAAILVDDVVTTGATLECCGRILAAQGFGPVWGLTFGGGSGWETKKSDRQSRAGSG